MQINLTTASQIKNVLSRAIDKKLSIQLAYKIMQFIKSIEAEEEFYNNKLREILLNYAQKDEKGEPLYTDDRAAIKIIEGKEDECYAKVDELQQLKVEISDNLTFSLEELEALDCTARELFIFDGLIK